MPVGAGVGCARPLFGKVAACIAFYSASQQRKPASDADHALMGPGRSEADYREASGLTYASTAVPTSA